MPPFSSTRGSSTAHQISHWLHWLLLAVLLGSAPGSWALSLYEQRAAYRQALDQLRAGQTRRYQELKRSLDDYVLRPYLDYHEIRSRISSATPEQIAEFRRTHSELPVADIVYYRWLKRLGAAHRWDTFIEHFEVETEDTELRCYHLRALLATGEKEEALDAAGELWLAPKSQPKACDPLFEAWIGSGRLTESVVWTRLGLALDANARTLARYLQRFFVSPDVKPWAQSYYNVHVTPSSVTNTSRFTTDTRYSREVIAHGLARLANRDPEAAAQAWLQYQDSHDFDEPTTAEIEHALLVGFAREGQFPPHADVAADAPAEPLAQAALAQQQWSDLSFWIERLPQADRETRRWQYWLARSLGETTLDSKRAELTFASLAAERDYYGFLAAEQIGLPISMNHEPARVSSMQINRLRNLPGLRRATELFAVGDQLNARREWYQVLPTLTSEEKATAATLAGSIGWTSQGIRTANDGDLRNSLELRFPLPYQDEFQRVSHVTTVPETFLLAVARQESLFDPRARSSADARGLMQLIQPTAERVARRVGIAQPSTTELYDPALNIELGGHYLADLLVRYGQRRPLAAAAYNAGEHRVDRWIRDESGLWMDVWIETIPFRETRNYVKNVLAFAKVYGQRRGSPRPMLEAHETRVP